MKLKLYDDQLIVITGAAGFIGSGVVRALNDKGYPNLLLVDDFEKTEKWKNLRHKRFVDFISRHELFEFLQGKEREVEAFIHLGACSDTVEIDGDFLMKTNYRFSVKLAEYALTHGHRFIYASSAATYGNGSKGFYDDEERLDELSPLNLYGFSKHMFDKWLKEQKVLDKVVGLKYFNIFGPNERHKGRMGSMVMHMYDQIQKEGRVRLFKSSEKEKYADGEQVRDFYYVKDAVKMTCFFLENDLCGIFNAGSGASHTWNQMAKQIFKLLDKKPNIEYIPMPEDLIKNYQNYTVADMSKFQSALEKKELSFENEFTFESAIDDYVTNYLMKDVRW
ncbi:MAG: ADP-glyceromanno-heptose 6-epimerase [Simkania negevensis]|nr:ADP-glyceromanno-heptose 6-epimerase [Simkania negevensis]